MKWLLIVPLLLSRCFALSDQPCDQVQAIVSLSAGTPWNTYVEAGVMGIAGNIGLYGGVIEYQTKSTITNGKTTSPPVRSSFYLRQSYTVMRAELGNNFLRFGGILRV